MDINKLIKKYPELWGKAQAKFQNEEARERYFLALYHRLKAKELSAKSRKIENREKAKKRKLERKRLARALIILGRKIVDQMAYEELERLVRQDSYFKVKEGEGYIDLGEVLLNHKKQRESKEQG